LHDILFDEWSLDQQLLSVRAGTTFLSSEVDRLSDDELDRASLLPNWTRSHLLAHVAYNAEALGRLLTWARTGVETPMYVSADHRQQEISKGATLNAPELRRMFEQNALKLDEAWTSMPSSAWSATVRTAQGRMVPASETLWMRTREVWVHAVDLDAGADFEHVPEVVLWSLFSDIIGLWRTRDTGQGIVLHVTDQEPLAVQGDSPPTITVEGSLAAVVRWAAGRGATGVSLSGQPSSPPKWI
jgi:maleylpyruvate isomerase